MPRLRIVLLVLGLSLASQAASGQVLVFRARVEQLGMRTGWLNEGKALADTVEVVLPGEWFEPPRVLGPTPKTEWRYGTPIEAVQSDFSAWKADDADAIVEGFVAGERADVAAFLGDGDMRAANRKIFEGHAELRLWGVARQGAHALVLFTYDRAPRARGMVSTFKSTAEGWKRTNALSAERTADVVWGAFRQGSVVAR
jgi:hypothetical protein